MTVSELICNADFNLAWDIIEKEYYAEDENKIHLKETYRSFLLLLKKLELKENKQYKILSLIEYFDDLEEDIEMKIWDISMFSHEDDTIYSLSFIDWDEVMEYDICEKSLNDYGVATITAHLLYELSFWGFDKQSVTVKKEELAKRHEEIENGTDELISIDEFFAELGYVDTQTDEEKEVERKRTEYLMGLNKGISDSFIAAMKQQCIEQKL